MRLRRGSLDIGLVIGVVLIVVGAVIGSGLAQRVLATPDPLTWLRNLRGELTQFNPETGTPVNRLPVGLAGDDLRVVQGDGVLVVFNPRTNSVITIDTSMLRIAGSRPWVDTAVQLLLTKGEVYVADLANGVIERIDALTATTMGRPWRSEAPLVAVAADDNGSVWALADQGRLTGLRWDAEPETLVPTQRHTIDGVGTQAALAAHDQGVTVIDPSGRGAQVGTRGQDRELSTDALPPPLVPPLASPAALVPVVSLSAATVALIRPDGPVDIDAGDLGCREPGQPAVFAERIYLPCLGAGKVLVLDADGRPAREALVTDGDPELVLNAGLLIVNALGSEFGYVVKPDGSVQRVRTHDPDLPVPEPTARATARPSQPAASPTPNPSGSGGSSTSGAPTTAAPTGPRPTGGATTPTRPPTPSTSTATATSTATTPTSTPSTSLGTTTTPTPNPVDYIPTGVTAQATAAGTVQVDWETPRIRPSQGFEIVRADAPTTVLVTALPLATSAIVTGLPTGRYQFIVISVDSTGRYTSGPSNEVATFGLPAAPQVGATLVARSPATFQLRISVTPTGDPGSPITSYDIAASYTSGNGDAKQATGIPIGQEYLLTMDCRGLPDPCLSGGSVSITAALTNAAGTGAPTTITVNVDPPPLWQYGRAALFVTVDGRCLDASFTVQACSGASSQLWTFGTNGNVTNQARPGQCLRNGSAISFTAEECGLGGGGASEGRRWNRVGLAAGGTGGPVSNTGFVQGENPQRCLFAAGGVVNLREPCRFSNEERIYVFTISGPMTAALSGVTRADEPAGDAPIGLPLTAVLLLPIVVGLVRLRPGRRRGGRSA